MVAVSVGLAKLNRDNFFKTIKQGDEKKGLLQKLQKLKYLQK